MIKANRAISVVLSISVFLMTLTTGIALPSRQAYAGIPSEIVGVENDFGSAGFDNVIGIGSGYLGDKGAEIAEEGLKNAPNSSWYSKLGNTSKILKWGGFVIGTIDTVRDTYNIYAENSKHSHWIGKWTDKGLMIIGTGMGWAATIGTIMTIGATAPATGTVAVVTGTGFAVATAGVAIVRGAFNTETVRNIEDLAAGKKKLVFAPFERPDIKEGRNIIIEELGFDPYDHSSNEIPDPSTGIPVYKPNIYFYSNADINANVKIYPYQFVTEAIPEYDPHTGWEAVIRNGSLNGKNDFIFYEAIVPDEGFQTDSGWRIRGSEINNDLLGVLKQYGFNDPEQKDFVDFWTNFLDSDKNYFMYPQTKATVDVIMPLFIQPQPDNINRIWFYFIEEGSERNYSSTEAGAPVIIEKIVRNSFTVVEWGGLIKKQQ